MSAALGRVLSLLRPSNSTHSLIYWTVLIIWLSDLGITFTNPLSSIAEAAAESVKAIDVSCSQLTKDRPSYGNDSVRSTFLQNYKGRWVKWKGIVSNVNETLWGAEVGIKCSPHSGADDVTLIFDQDSKSRLAQFHPGREYRFKGQIEDCSENEGVLIRHAEMTPEEPEETSDISETNNSKRVASKKPVKSSEQPPPPPTPPASADHGTSRPALTFYGDTLKAAVESHWKFPQSMTAKNLEAIIVLVVNRDGMVQSLRFDKTSGDSSFDQSVVKAIREAEPLPPIPTGISYPKVEVRITFSPANNKGDQSKQGHGSRSVEKSPPNENRENLLKAAQMHESRGDYAEALKELEQILKKDPRDQEVKEIYMRVRMLMLSKKNPG